MRRHFRLAPRNDLRKAAELRTFEENSKGLRFKPYPGEGSGEGYRLETGSGFDRRTPKQRSCRGGAG